MNRERVFRVLVVASTACYVAYYFLPYEPWHVSDEGSRIVQRSGHGAKIPVDHPLYYWSVFVLWLVAALGMLFFQNWARHLCLALNLVLLVLIPLSGFSVQTPLESLLSATNAVLDGAILALAYLSPLAEEFRRRVT